MRSQVRGELAALREAHAPGGGPLAGDGTVRERLRRVRSRIRTREIVASAIYT